jgi:hypothetical protein
LNCTFSSLFHNRAALLALGNGVLKCKRGAKDPGGEHVRGKSANMLISNVYGGEFRDFWKTCGFRGGLNRVKPAR